MNLLRSAFRTSVVLEMRIGDHQLRFLYSGVVRTAFARYGF